MGQAIEPLWSNAPLQTGGFWAGYGHRSVTQSAVKSWRFRGTGASKGSPGAERLRAMPQWDVHLRWRRAACRQLTGAYERTEAERLRPEADAGCDG